MADSASRIRRSVDDLRQLIAMKITKSVIGWCLMHNITRAQDLEYRGTLSSPYRQLAFLQALLLQTSPPIIPQDVTKVEWERICELLEEAFGAYQDLFWPESEMGDAPGPAWWRVREVAMPAFLHYFNTGLLASVEQVKSRIGRYLVPFDSELEALLGISASAAVEIAGWVADELDRTTQRVIELQAQLQAIHASAVQQGVPPDKIAEYLAKSGQDEAVREYAAAMQEMAMIHRERLVSTFPDVGQAYWDRYTVSRGTGPRIEYPTEPSVVEVRPLVSLSSHKAFCTSGNSVFIGVLRACEAALSESDHRDRYLAHRDRVLEDEVAENVRKLLGTEAAIYRATFERPDAHGEHDIVAIAGDMLLIVEAKASPPKEPLRDPNRAYVRIERAFRSDTGIQRAFEQGASIRRRLDAGEVVPLFDRKGATVVELNPAVLTRRFVICATRDDFGPLATDLSLMLQKHEEEPYPWAVNVFDLDAISDAWTYFDWGSEKLDEYLADRVRLHGRVFGTDELEYVGYFIKHGPVGSSARPGAEHLMLNPQYSNFFDELHYHLYYEQPAPTVSVTEPFIMDLRASLTAGEAVRVPGARDSVGRPGRNSRCPCGSGRKYKECHGSGKG